MDSALKLYSYRRCPFAMRVRLALHEKGIPFTVIEEDLSNFSKELRSLHPEAKVPVLVHGKLALYESCIITEYIEDAFPETTPLMPIEAELRAQIRLWTYWCNQSFKPDLDRLKYGTNRFTEAECVDIEKKVEEHLKKLESSLQKGQWLVGSNFSLAEVHVFPFVRQVTRIKPEPLFLPRFPTLLQWVERITTRPSFTKSMA